MFNEHMFFRDLHAPEPSLEPPSYNPPERYCDNCAFFKGWRDGSSIWGCTIGHDPLSFDHAAVCADYDDTI